MFENEQVKAGYITVNAPSPATGSLSIQSIPGGASITLDGVTLSGRTTPYTATGLTTGNHLVQLTLSGYEDYIETVSVSSGQTTTLNAALTANNQPPGTTGSASIASTPTGAMISIDTVTKGMTPMTVPNLLPGTHAVRLTLNGYEEYNAVITIVAGQETPLNVPLVKTGTTSGSSTGTITVTSNPAGASINLDGWDKGASPQTLSNVKAGEHTLSLKLAGYNDWSAKVVVGGGQNTPVSVTLTPRSTEGGNPAGSGSIVVASTPSGANVYLDGDLKGTSPLVIQDVSAGYHKILLTMKGYTDTQEIVEVKAGSTEKVSASLAGGNRLPGFTVLFAVVSLAAVCIIRRYYS